jgi:2-polyprenyl-6-methoxyphenol hydroxylase-like FAD-dependent oxidoreductase
VHFEDGNNGQGQCLIVADGINSVIRKKYFPQIKMRYANQVIWRGITKLKLPEYYHSRFVEVCGPQQAIFICSMDIAYVFWLAVKQGEPGGKTTPVRLKRHAA